jgi:hypothetical protein
MLLLQPLPPNRVIIIFLLLAKRWNHFDPDYAGGLTVNYLTIIIN